MEVKRERGGVKERNKKNGRGRGGDELIERIEESEIARGDNMKGWK